jgi:uncharacterized surface protein with fasciclin (FAS1) repeats
MRIASTSNTSMAGFLATSAIAAAVALAAAACGSTSGAAAPAASGASSHHAMTHHAAAAATFGPDCGMVPASGMGSLHGMMTDPVVTAASHNPLLTTLAADVKTAGLTAALDSMGSITVFAPADSAFSKLPHAMMTSMMHNPQELAKVLKYHVVSGHVSTARLASGKPLTTLEGSTLTPAKMGAVYEVNHASVICGNIQTANATVYIIDKVLMPMH